MVSLICKQFLSPIWKSPALRIPNYLNAVAPSTSFIPTRNTSFFNKCKLLYCVAGVLFHYISTRKTISKGYTLFFSIRKYSKMYALLAFVNLYCILIKWYFNYYKFTFSWSPSSRCHRKTESADHNKRRGTSAKKIK